MTESRPRYRVTRKETQSGRTTWWIDAGGEAHSVETHDDALVALMSIPAEAGDLVFSDEHERFRFGLELGIPVGAVSPASPTGYIR